MPKQSSKMTLMQLPTVGNTVRCTGRHKPRWSLKMGHGFGARAKYTWVLDLIVCGLPMILPAGILMLMNAIKTLTDATSCRAQRRGRGV